MYKVVFPVYTGNLKKATQTFCYIERAHFNNFSSQKSINFGALEKDSYHIFNGTVCHVRFCIHRNGAEL